MARRRLNRRYLLHNLQEAREHLDAAILKVKAGNQAGLEAWFPWIYRKLNRAWNCRHMKERERDTETDAEFEAACRFPADLAGEITASPPDSSENS